MKVFISHSSYDKWIAKTISRDLNELGFDTFLDEKDIQTGESIDAAIASHLADADELLLLLSPASLKSSWVFIEIGGAKALGKRIVPILLHVGTNEVPAPISQFLCRDINDIEHYYDELKKRKQAPTTFKKRPQKRRTPRITKSKISIGTVVRVKDPTTITDESKRKHPVWIPEMDALSGREFKVKSVEDGVIRLEGIFLGWLEDWLEIVP